MKSIIFIAGMVLLAASTYAQGCVAIRGTGAICTMADHQGMNDNKSHSKWQVNIGYRHFKSYKHFRGTHEEKERVINNTEVINWQHTLDVSVLYNINQRWSVMLGMPLVANKRSSLYEHGRTSRHNTESYGLSDMRLVVYRWLIHPEKAKKGNIQLGVGLKFATGDYNYQDYFYNVGPNGTAALRPVDQSIQPGDGGTGLITELNGFYNFSQRFGFYSNLFYMMNPKEVNGTLTYRSNQHEQVMSVADQYMGRLGINYAFAGKLKPLSTSVGIRTEGIPVEDLLGGNLGFRRPGYVWSVEPGINWMSKKAVWSLTVPVAVHRNRTQSIPDKLTTAETGVYRHGDAAFADYSINLGVSFRM